MKRIVVLGIMLLIMSALFVTANFSEHKEISCEPIDYEDEILWENLRLRGLYPIKDSNGEYITYPIGC